MHEQKAPRSSERGVFCWAAAGSIPAGAQPVRRRDAAKVDPRASSGHAIERRANVVREKAGKPRTQPQKEPQKCRKTSGQARDEALPGFFLVHRRKPWRLGERLRNLTPDFMDVRRRNCSIARHFRH
ncbi:transcriptional regulator [Burkholderia mallei]|uniref:Transcriptional regulator n=2 Tax=Burkholderia mallei TaxID=13373 RepID=A0AAX1X6F9_BURML|nr:hypothetical protein DM45_3083 [Burkholderia mallei]RKN92840.1 transcriptional regulator [Burkholderia mallei]RPA26092.1 transcriptional regulator [Burkholderia mallei]RPA43680.1 transcriptional regulator [Burkholderia mallei]